MTCATCKYSMREDGGTLCKRHPPTPFAIPTMNTQGLVAKGHIKIIAAFAPVDADQWCGEYEAQLDVGEAADANH